MPILSIVPTQSKYRNLRSIILKETKKQLTTTTIEINLDTQLKKEYFFMSEIKIQNLKTQIKNSYNPNGPNPLDSI